MKNNYSITKFIILLICFSLLLSCGPNNIEQKNNYQLIVIVCTENAERDTLIFNYTATHVLQPSIADNHVFNSSCSLLIGQGSWCDILATHVTHFKVISNNKY